MPENKDFNPFDYRPFIVREWTLEQFEEDSPVWELAWLMYRKKDTHVPERIKLDVLNDLRYLLVKARHNGGIDTTYCNLTLDKEALAQVAGSLLRDVESETNTFKPDLTERGEVPELIPYIELKAGFYVDFLGRAVVWWMSHGDEELEKKLQSLSYTNLEIDRLKDMLLLCLMKAGKPARAEILRGIALFEKANCPVHDEKLPEFVALLKEELEKNEGSDDFIDRYLPLYAAKKAGCLVKITKGRVMPFFSKAENELDKNFTPLNKETAKLAGERKKSLKNCEKTSLRSFRRAKLTK